MSAHERLYRRIRSLVLNGALPNGSSLASSRTLAKHLGMSRNSVLTAFDRLIADGWLTARKSSGVYVTYAGGAKPRKHAELFPSEEPKPFCLEARALDVFPARVWSTLQSRRWKAISSANLHMGDAQGWTPLREAIAAHAALTRGIDCTPDEVMVTTTVPAGIDLAVRALGLTGAEAWVEEPGYLAAKRALQNNAVRLAPVRVDSTGLDVGHGKRVAPDAKIAAVMPACHFPTNVAMSAARRTELLEWARFNKAWIFEDDYDWQSITATTSPKPIASKCRANVIYLNSFNPMLFPALRIAYMICPAALVDRFAAVRFGLDQHSNVPNQMVMTDFIEGGHLDQHLRRLREVYAERRATLLRALESELPERMSAQRQPAGTQVVATLRNLLERPLLARCSASGVRLAGLREFRLVETGCEEIVFGFAGFSPTVIAAAVRKMSAAIEGDADAGFGDTIGMAGNFG
ncbi:MAG TPA: PLP-dependent aminotransferase family protein [Rhizomicrobium sp.]|nr:PLP-dependent aminotransferase family protein [Rhizomicrobium sp.]